MPIKILVLCQRKKGRCLSNTTVERSVIPNIEKYLSNYLHTTDYKIDYLSQLDDPKPDDEVDFNMEIGDNAEFNTFLASKSQYYSIIVLNTCPYRFINYDYISQLLCNNGVVILSKVNCSSKYDIDLFNIPPTDNAISASNILTFFTFKDGFYIKINANANTNTNTNAKKRSHLVITNDDTDEPGVKTRQWRKLNHEKLNDAKKGGKSRNKKSRKQLKRRRTNRRRYTRRRK